MNLSSMNCKLKEYFEWENLYDFSGWEKLEIFMGESLVDAWLKARPNDKYKFENLEFLKNVKESNGKWLEKQFESDTYKIIVATGKGRTEEEICETIIHEMRHCLDFQISVNELSFQDYHVGNDFYNSWSEFRAVSVSVRYEFFLRNNINKDYFRDLSELLGLWNADCLMGLISSKGDPHAQIYFISRYVGASRTIRNLSYEYQVRCDAFELWNMAPTYITENYGNVFYLGNEWDEKKTCDLDVVPETYYFNDLCSRLTSNK